jgi:hypothetical protein
MKKLIILAIAVSFSVSNTAYSQKLLNRVRNAVSKEISGTTGKDSNGNSASNTTPGTELRMR